MAKNIEDYTRVTEVLFHFSGLKHIDSGILALAAERGTRVHEIFDALVEGIGVGPADIRLQGYIDSLEKWLPKKFINKPTRFFCDTYNITGECDAVYEDEEGLVLVDIKTPAKEGKTWHLQGSAYSWLAKQAGYDVKRIEFVRLSKIGQYPIIHTYTEDFPMFLKCLDVYNIFFKEGEVDLALDYV